MHSDRHTVGDADLFNDQVGKIGKYRHRLILDQEMVSLEILFCSLFYHIAIIEAAEEPGYAFFQRHFMVLVTTWLWQELAQRFGQEATNEIHRGFNKQQQIYQKSRVAKERQQREHELQRAGKLTEVWEFTLKDRT